MERAEALALLSPEGLALLDSLPPYESAADALGMVTALRRAGHAPELVAAVLTQARLRRKAAAKFGPFAGSMLFTEAGLEQATRLAVAARHADRFRAAGLTRIADLGCGIGGDALALAGLGLTVAAVERDEPTAAIAAYNLAPFEAAEVHHADAESFALDGVDGVWLDPARRSTGPGGAQRRHHDPTQYAPSLEFAFGIAERLPAGIKLGPGLDRALVPDWAEAQWVSDHGEVVELALFSAALARPGIRRSALVLRAGGAAELSAAADAPDAPVGPLGAVLYEPDGAVIRARLIGLLAERLGGARMVSESIAYLSGDEAVDSPFASAFRVREVLPLDVEKLGRRLRALGIGRLEIKQRGTGHDPATLRTALKLRGEEEATLLLTRVDGRHRAILADRLAPAAGNTEAAPSQEDAASDAASPDGA